MNRVRAHFRLSNGVMAIGLALVLLGVQGPLSSVERLENWNGLPGVDLAARSIPSGSSLPALKDFSVQPAARMAPVDPSALKAASPEDGWVDNPRLHGGPDPALQPIRLPVIYPPTRISIPSIKLEAPVELSKAYRVTIEHRDFLEWEAPATFAAGWQEGSAPLGLPGNTVINGHNNVNGDVFLYLVKVKVGDRIDVYSSETRFSYQVTNRMLLPEEFQELEIRLANAVWIQPSPDERLTLVTCWPWNGNSHRLVVVAAPVSAAAQD